ncbi:hypothetical protein BT96DRAFT_1014323 [Gymnopus androsaceus JB14]|uniref:Uncharacterized protein n=1 Tax=Gymnopus androsaceus JB14 TaxID=1447944 RepID=A0A6A4I9G6_9AGAR|nr:hypothetical protein BT96DRAFT_1014323 [Gymnopus androsaceus JB14]
MSPNAAQTNQLEHSAEINALLTEPASTPRTSHKLHIAILIFLMAILISCVPDIRRLEPTSRDPALFGLGVHLSISAAVAFQWRERCDYNARAGFSMLLAVHNCVDSLCSA